MKRTNRVAWGMAAVLAVVVVGGVGGLLVYGPQSLLGYSLNRSISPKWHFRMWSYRLVAPTSCCPLPPSAREECGGGLALGPFTVWFWRPCGGP
jgi:hypothetical protein